MSVVLSPLRTTLRIFLYCLRPYLKKAVETSIDSVAGVENLLVTIPNIKTNIPVGKIPEYNLSNCFIVILLLSNRDGLPTSTMSAVTFPINVDRYIVFLSDSFFLSMNILTCPVTFFDYNFLTFFRIYVVSIFISTTFFKVAFL